MANANLCADGEGPIARPEHTSNFSHRGGFYSYQPCDVVFACCHHSWTLQELFQLYRTHKHLAHQRIHCGQHRFAAG
eukprot:scaffold6381_cov69-Cyclotella_meneghiniana.AAC.5